jgi:uncharacterized protein YukE
VAADDNLRVDPQVMQGFAQGLLGAAEGLRNQLSELDGQIGELLGGWRGASGDAYGSAWESGTAEPSRWSRGCRCWPTPSATTARAISKTRLLTDAVERMTEFQRYAERMLSEIDSLVSNLHTTWTGEGATAHAEAHQLLMPVQR